MGFAAIGMPPLLIAGGLVVLCVLWLQTVRWTNNRRLHWTQK